ncbi:branched-chain amino acid ABC transporter permease [Pusillimonas sp.]|uniref:branched-chain amino acid ABC transporter permease n=1 Tax=Pusillimonas sp. TaxID=3040095 RepID=UPI0029B21276|nr:branched-chain amino acid ABC transporter permease [Pusillimonas sp.]MDX3895587.1 branched-chain amino acid ABC transporter permease [Pusillimonas sp.]
MDPSIVLMQFLNGIQYGALLFLLSAGLTLLFGIMNFVNLMHGSLYMMGAYIAAESYSWTGSFAWAAVMAFGGVFLLGIALDRLAIAKLYDRNHLNQVLATFGFMLFFNELVTIIWGPVSIYTVTPPALSGAVQIFGVAYPVYRLFIIGVALLVGLGLYLVIHRTRIGMLVRAGASVPGMVSGLGVNVKLLKMMLFGFGAALAGLAGFMAGPITSIQSGMGEPVLILALVVIVTGGIGSVRGAFYGALIIGLIDTFGRAFLPGILQMVFNDSIAQTTGPALAAVMVYLLMAVILVLRPNGLFPVKYG